MRLNGRLSLLAVGFSSAIALGACGGDSPTAPSSLDLGLAQQGTELGELAGASLGDPALPSAPQDTDDTDDECARSPGFWCQNQDGQNPNMSLDDFNEYADLAALMLSGIPGLDTVAGVSAAVCDTSDQLHRQLATLALNLAAGLVDEDTVGDAFDEAIEVAKDLGATQADRNEIKDVLDRINNNVNTDGPCSTPDDDDDDSDSDGKVTVCHKGKKTLTIGASAVPAHLAHGDTRGPRRHSEAAIGACGP